jgi:Spy/CpxP family protein refolding chaperone
MCTDRIPHRPPQEFTMKMTLLALALSLPVAALAQAAAPAPAATAPVPGKMAAKPEQEKAASKELEKAVMAERADIVAKNLGLTADQATRFWPVYRQYQAGISELFAQQLELVVKYVSGYDKLDDAGATALVVGQLDRDAKVTAYRQKWLREFQKVLPGKMAAKFMQIDRRMALVTQLQMASQIPVIQ